MNSTSPSPSPAPARTLPPFQSVFPADEFAQRRIKLAEEIGKKACAVLQGGEATGAFDRFRQSNVFFYLTGVEVPHAYLLVRGNNAATTLYLPPRDEKLERSDGPQLNCDNADAAACLTGIASIRPLSALSSDLAQEAHIYTPFAPAEGRQTCRDTQHHAQKLHKLDPWRLSGSREEHFREKLRGLCSHAEILDLSPILDRLRMLKSPREVQHLRRCGQLTAFAIHEAMRATRPGIYEYQLAALADCLFQLNGSLPGGGYRPIVASGKNIWNAHYFQNSARLESGDWVLMDFAPDCANYTSDIGRYWPVNGRYSNQQRELYGFIVSYHVALLRRIRPGVTADTILQEAASEMDTVIRSRRWSNSAFEQAARETLKFRGHLSHSVGMAVHDPGDYRHEPLRPGTVFALDPQMWVPSAELYVRVEDTVVVTEEGVEVLTTGAPLELDAVEALMAQPLSPGISSRPEFQGASHPPFVTFS